MTHKENVGPKFNEELRSTIKLQDQCHYDQFVKEESDDIIVILKDNKNQAVIMKKIQRCKVCLKNPNNCLCKQKGASLRSNMSVVSQMSFYSDASYGFGRQQVNKR